MIVLRKPQQSVHDYFTDLCLWYRPYTTSHSNLPVLKITTSRISPKWDVAWFFPREWKTAEFYSKDIDSAVENTLVSLQGLSFSKILSLILIHVNDEYFAPTRTAVLLRAYCIPAYITAESYAKLHSAYRWITQMKIFSVRDRNVLYFFLTGLFQSEKSSQFFKLICSK